MSDTCLHRKLDLVSAAAHPHISRIADNRFCKRRRLRDQLSSRLQEGSSARGPQSIVTAPPAFADAPRQGGQRRGAACSQSVCSRLCCSNSHDPKRTGRGGCRLRISNMSERAPLQPQEVGRGVPSSRTFRRSASSRSTPEQLRRQDSVVRLAWRSLGASDPVIAFLNTHNEHLGGQPLYLALDSDAGLLRVERLLADIGLKSAERRT
jgi:hypothetical protein